MADRVPALKQESGEGDLFPNEFDPNEDAIDVRGVFIQSDTSDDDTVQVTRDASDRMMFQDGNNLVAVPLNDLINPDPALDGIIAFSAYDNTGGTSIDSGWTDVPLDTERKKTPDFTHLASSAEVTIGQDTTYLVSATVAIAQTSVGSRSEAQMKVQINTGSGFTDIPGTFLTIYSRTTTQGKGAVTKVFILDLEDGDILKMQAQRESGSGGLVLSAGSELTITTLGGGGGDEVDDILTNNGGDFLANSGGNILKKG